MFLVFGGIVFLAKLSVGGIRLKFSDFSFDRGSPKTNFRVQNDFPRSLCELLSSAQLL